MASYITLAPQCVPLALASSSSINPLGGIVCPCPLLLVIGSVSVATPQLLELMPSPRNPFGGFTKWLLLCLGGSPPCLIVQSNG